MWSLNSQRERRTSGPENFQSSAKKDFFNNRHLSDMATGPDDVRFRVKTGSMGRRQNDAIDPGPTIGLPVWEHIKPLLRNRPAVVHLCVGEISIR